MKLNVKFEESSAEFPVAFASDDEELSVKFDGTQILKGDDGESAYEIAVRNGFVGSEAAWLASLHGRDGVDGKDGRDGIDGRDGKDGYTPIKGKDYFDGRDGVDGKDGYTPVKGKDYFTAEDISEAANEAAALVGKDTFIAVQNVTTAQEVMDAINAGKAVFARSSNTYYVLTNYDSSTIRFSRAYQSTTSHLTLNRSTDKWAAGSTTHAAKVHTHDWSDIMLSDDDKAEIAQMVISALPVYGGEVE